MEKLRAYDMEWENKENAKMRRMGKLWKQEVVK